MFAKRIYGMLLCMMLAAGPALAGNIIWVDEGAADGFADWQALLEGAGHSVTQMSNLTALDQGIIDTLNAADLVIVSRDTNSGGYDDGEEPTQWNGLTVPLIQTSAYLIRSSRWQWVNSTGTPAVGATDNMVIVQDHPMFKGIADVGDEVAMVVGVANLSDSTDGGNGQVLATHTDGRLWITYWEAETEFYPGTTQAPAAPRLWFAAGLGQDTNEKGMMNLTDAGQAIFLNAVRFLTGGLNPELASAPSPAVETVDIPRDVVLGWTPGEYAAKHDVYLGTVLDDVNTADRANPMDVLVSQNQDANSYDPDGVLEFGQTYYWRVDEVNATPDNTIFKGELWSFTVEPFAYAIENVIATSNATSDPGMGPERTIDGSGLNEMDQHSVASADMWLGAGNGVDPVQLEYAFDRLYKLHEMLVWNYNVAFEPVLGFGLKDVTVEHSVDGLEWTLLGDAELAQATASADYAANTTVDFGGVAAQFVKITVNSNYGGLPQFGLSELRFLQIPAFPREPEPASGATDVGVDPVLSWRAGRGAASHDVSFGTDQDALEVVDSISEAAFVPGALDYGTTYYWKIDEVNEAEAISVWEGDIWGFSTQEYAVVDDFESYTDDEGSRIYETWIDGYGVADNGSQVGHLESPFAETTVVHSGSQSMPLFYDNASGATLSEAMRDLGGLNLAANGAENLQLFFRGNPVDFLERPDGSIVIGAAGADIWDTADECRFVYKNLNGDGEIVARVDSIENAVNAWAKAGVMIRESTDAGARNAFMAMTGGNGGGATFQQRPANSVNSQSQHTLPGNPFAPPYYVKVTRVGNSFSGFISPDGATWQQAGDTIDVEMAGAVLVGLAVTSHESGVPVGVTFSEVSTTGSVTGGWTVETIGVEMPSNDPAPLYVALEDTAGKVQTITHPDAAAVGAAAWTEWAIPLDDFSVVNTGSIKTMYIGIGPSVGATGVVYVDDIRYGRPLPEPASEE